MAANPSKLFEDYWDWRMERTPEFSSLVTKRRNGRMRRKILKHSTFRSVTVAIMTSWRNTP